MLILSWNVAGLSTTVNRIHDNYSNNKHQPTTTKKTKKGSAQHPAAALASYLERHGAEIVCLQEHKISKSVLTNRSEPRQASSIPGYESFWSCCVDDAAKGLNGVVTYAKAGTVQSADGTAPLGSPDLDRQGRCVRTDHGPFCVFNVYVPCNNGPFKMKFLRALRSAMQQQRALGKAVILVGDLNIAQGKLDIFWKNRVVYINDILQEAAAAAAPSNSSDPPSLLPSWKRDVARHWRQIAAVLETKQVVATQTTNSRTSATYNKFRLAVTVTDKAKEANNSNNTRRVFLGNHELTPDHCSYCYDLSAQTYIDEETGETVQSREENAVRVGILAELMSKIAGVQWSEERQREIADQYAEAERGSPTRKWLNAVLQEDGMVDAFRHFYPTAQARFTCWNQNKNRRYANDGARIDYTLVDRSLLPHVRQGTETLRCAAGEHPDQECSEEAALRAATANGLFRPVSFEGGGMTEASREALDTQFGPPHTGHVYTPPTFSDHIAVSLLLDDAVTTAAAASTSTTATSPQQQVPQPPVPLQLQDDAATRKAQPHKRQKSIASFFQQAAPSAKSQITSSSSSSSKKQPRSLLHTGGNNTAKRTKKPPANSILHHFRKTNTNSTTKK